MKNTGTVEEFEAMASTLPYRKEYVTSLEKDVEHLKNALIAIGDLTLGSEESHEAVRMKAHYIVCKALSERP